MAIELPSFLSEQNSPEDEKDTDSPLDVAKHIFSSIFGPNQAMCHFWTKILASWQYYVTKCTTPFQEIGVKWNSHKHMG